MHILSVREQPQYARRIIAYLQQYRQTVPPALYSDCVNHCIGAANPLPQWYVLEKGWICTSGFVRYLSTRNTGSATSATGIIRGISNRGFTKPVYKNRIQPVNATQLRPGKLIFPGVTL